MSGVRGLSVEDADDLARLHARAFPAPWPASAFTDLLSQDGVFGLGVTKAGFILCRVVADEAEILTLATLPEVRRRGLGRRLVEAALENAVSQGATRMFLEVAEDNIPALTLYDRIGFSEVGRRRGYYDRSPALAVDARVLAFECRQDLPST